MILMSVFLLMIAACAQQDQAEPLIETDDPVTEEVATQPPTPTPLQRATLPPTWTPSPPPENIGIQSQVTPVDSGAQQQPEQTDIVEQAPPTPLEVCALFGEDRDLNKRTFTLGTPVQVYWTAVQGAASYSISLIDPSGEVIMTGYTVQPTFVFEPDLFQRDTIYGWEAYPVDPAGRQMCLSRGAELVPDTRPGG
jgi:hypothetical protein